MSVLVSHHRFRELVDTYFATVEEWPADDKRPAVLHAVIDGLPLCAIAPRAEQHQDAA